MQSLSTGLRNRLECTVKKARDVSEDAARAVLEQLGVHLKDKPGHLNDQQAGLRVHLRAHARQLGDIRYPDARQAIDRLVVETAYEHWHRMLFARFLAENHLLMHPDGVAVSLAECEELANDEGAADGWELAGRYAARMLPQIFRPDSPVMQLNFAPEHKKRLEKLLSDLEREIFTASDSLGWVYQFWQTKKKDEVNASEVKIGADELPAVTQLFTEPYMVQFLLHNSLGAWWVVNHPDEPCPVELTYLRTIEIPQAQGERKCENGAKIPAAGKYEDWPRKLAELKLLDPSCGSGHFLVAAFLMLVAMRMQEEGLSAKEACDAVLRDNIHGLELDRRCVEIAVFALALTAWTYPDAGGYRPLPEMNLACSGLAVSTQKEEWLAFAGDDPKLRQGMAQLYDLFKDAPTLGSLINPNRMGKEDMFTAGYDDLVPLMEMALAKEKDDYDADEIGVAAQGLAKAAYLLAGKYHLIITNVPYLSRGKQCDKLKDFCETWYGFGKNDLANVFLERCMEFNAAGGVTQIVMPQNWLFLKSYKKLRDYLLKHQTWCFLSRLGPGAFDTITGEVVNVILITFANAPPIENHLLRGLDATAPRSSQNKSELLKIGNILEVSQHKQLENPDSKVSLSEIDTSSNLDSYAIVSEGLHTGDYPRFGRKFWEIEKISSGWALQQGGPSSENMTTGLEHILYWCGCSGPLIDFIRERLGSETVSMWIKGEDVWGKKGVSVSSMGDLQASIYMGEIFTHGIYAVVPHDGSNLPAVWAYCDSSDFRQNARLLDQKVCIARSSIAKVPFDIDHWIRVAAEKYPNGLPKPYSDDPTQWIFHGHPVPATTPLQVAIARLLGYRWPAETDEKMELSDEARAWVQKTGALLPFSDDNGIVCIPPVRGEKPAAERLLNLLSAAYGVAWSPYTLSKLLADADCTGKTLEVWLRDKFFEQHFKLFHHRPFIWHIWDGVKDGFAALLNYHKLTRQNLETLIYSSIGDWIKRQEDEIKQGIDGAGIRLAAARNLKTELEKILEGEQPFDIFVRWKPMDQQPIGWEPDLNDGVRLNIRPFIQAGILRKNSNITWNKDRGKDVTSSPWYELGLNYGGKEGDRINDHHLSLAEKKAARTAKQ